MEFIDRSPTSLIPAGSCRLSRAEEDGRRRRTKKWKTSEWMWMEGDLQLCSHQGLVGHITQHLSLAKLICWVWIAEQCSVKSVFLPLVDAFRTMPNKGAVRETKSKSRVRPDGFIVFQGQTLNVEQNEPILWKKRRQVRWSSTRAKKHL